MFEIVFTKRDNEWSWRIIDEEGILEEGVENTLESAYAAVRYYLKEFHQDF